MKITTLSIFVDDQRKALAFYTDVLGFELKDDMNPRRLDIRVDHANSVSRSRHHDCQVRGGI